MNRGRLGGILTHLVMSKLMGCSLYICKKELKELEEPTLEDLGNLIYEYRKEQMELKEARLLDRYFSHTSIYTRM